MNRSTGAFLGRPVRGTLAGGLTAVLILALSACEPTQSPVAPDSLAGVAPVAAARAGGWVTRVTGGGNAQFATGVIQNFQVQATEWANGSVTGRFSSRARVPNGQNQLPFDFAWKFDVDIDCLAIDGERAWMGGTVSQVQQADTPFPFPLDVGTDFIFVTSSRDAGPDVPPGFYGPASDFGTSDCSEQPEGPALPPAKLHGGFTFHQR